MQDHENRTQLSTRGAPRILLAEDDASSRRALAVVLRDLGLDVQELTDGGRLLVTIGAQYKDVDTPDAFDVIVSDVRMPVVSGLDIFRVVRAAHWATPVLLMTAYPNAEVEDAAMKLGAKLLVKPFDLDVFERIVLQLVARRRPEFRPSKPGA